MSTSSHSPSNKQEAVPRARILILIQNDSFPDDTRVRLQASTLRDAGYPVTVICPTGTSRRRHEVLDGVRVIRYPQPWEIGGFIGYVCEYAYSLSVTFLLALYVALRYGFDVIHARTPPDMVVVVACVFKLFGKRYVIDMNDLPLELYQAQHDGAGNHLVCRVLQWFEAWNCHLADRFIATSATQRRVQIERGGAPPDRCRLVRNVPSERFLEPVEPLESLRKPDRIVIGYMGITGIQDRVDVMLRVLDALKNKFGRTDFLGVIVGAGAALNDLKRLAQELDLTAHVQFAGYRVGDDLLRHVASFDIGVVPDPSNPYNDSCAMLKLMEYMAMAKPVVAFDLPENRLTAGEAAIFVEDNDVLEFARQIDRLMDDADLRGRLGQLGQQRVRHHLMWEFQQQELLDAYEQLYSAQQPLAEGQPEGPYEATGTPLADEERVLV